MRRLWGGLLVLGLLGACGPAQVDLRSSLIRDRLQKILELTSVEMTFREVIYVQDPQRLQWLFGISPWSKKALFSVNLKVQAGFNLALGYEIKKGNDPEEVELILPPAQILGADAEESSIREYFSTGGNLNFGKFQALLSDRSDAVKQSALKLGILEKARSQVLTFAQGLFVPLGYKRVQVSFRSEPGVLPVPKKTEAEAPQGSSPAGGSRGQ